MKINKNNKNKKHFLKTILFVFSFFLFFGVNQAFAFNCVSNASTVTWTTSSHWTGCNGTTPQTTDTITILDGHTVNQGANRQVAGVTINEGGTLAGSSFTLTNTGDYILNGIHSGTGTMLLSGSGTNISGAGSRTNTATITITNNKTIVEGTNLTFSSAVAVSASTSVTNNGTLIITGNFTGTSGTWIQGENSILRLGGATTSANTIGTFIATATGNIVEYNRAGNQTCKVATYYNLYFSVSGTKTCATTAFTNVVTSGTVTWTSGASYTASGDITIGSGTSVTFGAHTIVVNGTIDVGGTWIVSSTTGTKTVNNIIVNNGGLINFTANEALTVNGNIQVDGTGSITPGTATWTFSGTSKTFSGTGEATLGVGAVTGSYTNNGTVSFSGNLTGAGSWTQGENSTLKVAGSTTSAMSVSTTDFTALGNTVNYNRSGTQTCKVTQYYNLILSGTSAKTCDISATILNNLTMEGSATWTLSTGLTVSNQITLGGTATLITSNNTLSTNSVTMDGGTFTPDSTVINVTGTGTVWTYNSGTYTVGTSTIKLTNTSASSKTFAGGGATYNNIWLAGGSGGGSYIISGDNTFNDFRDDGTVAHSIQFTSGSTQTINTFDVNGQAGQLIAIDSTGEGVHNLVSTGSNITVDYVSVQKSVASGTGTWTAGENSVNNNSAGSGWIFAGTATTILGDGTDPGNSTIGPGGDSTVIDRFSLSTSTGTDTVTGMTVTLGPENAYENIALVEVKSMSGEPGAFEPLGLSSQLWRSIAVDKSNQNVYYTIYDGGIFKQTGGTGDFVNLNQATKAWFGIAVNSSNQDVYAIDYLGDIHKQTGGTGDFVELGQSFIGWYSIAIDSSNNNVYATKEGGDIYKQTGGTGDFVGLGQTSRNWYGIAVNSSNQDVYAVVNNGDIYKQTGGTGDFEPLGQTTRGWYDIDINSSTGDVYATDWNVGSGGDIYKQTNSTGNFVGIGETIRPWYDLAIDSSNHNIYATVQTGTIYKQTGVLGETKCSLAPTSNVVELTDCNIGVTTTPVEYEIWITPKTHENMPAVPGASYATTATVTEIVATNDMSGEDTNSAIITIDNLSTGEVTLATVSASETEITIDWTNPGDADLHSIIVLRRENATVSDVLVEGAIYALGNMVGDSLVVCVLLEPDSDCVDSDVSSGIEYNYKIFTRDNFGNYSSTGVIPSGSPISLGADVMTISGTTNLSDEAGVVRIAINGDLSNKVGSIVSGAWSIGLSTFLEEDDVLVIFVQNQIDANESTAVAKYDGSENITGLVLNANVLTIGSSDNKSFSLTDLATYDCLANENVMYRVSSNVLYVEGQGCAGSVNNDYSAETLSILGSNTLVVGTSETVISSKISNAGTLTLNGNAILNLNGTSGTLFTNSGTINKGTSTTNISGNGDATLGSGSLAIHNLTISGTGTKTLGDNLTIGGDLTISAGTTELSTYDISVSGTTSITSTLSDNSATGTNLFIGPVIVGSGGVWTNTNNPSYSFRGNLTVNIGSTFTSGTGAYTFNTNSQNIGGTATYTITNIQNNITSGSGLIFSTNQPSVTTLTQNTNSILTISGDVPTITTLNASLSGNEVRYTGSAQTIKGATYHNLLIQNFGEKTLNGNTTINGNLTIGENATLNPTASYSFTGSGSNTLETTGTIKVPHTTFAESYNSFETLTLNTNSTVDYSGAGAQTILNTPTYYNLTLSGSGIKTAGNNINFASGGVLNVSGSNTIFDPLEYQINGAGSNTLAVSSGNTLRVGASIWGTNYNAGFSTINLDSESLVEYSRGGNQTIASSIIYPNLKISGSGIKSLNSNMQINGELLIASGTIDLTESNYDILVEKIIISGGAMNARSSDIVLSGGSQTIFDFVSGVFTSDASTINVINSDNNIKTFNGGNQTFNNLIFSGNGTLEIFGSNTFNQFENLSTYSQNINFEAGSTNIINLFRISGRPGFITTLNSTNPLSKWYLQNNNPGLVVDLDYLSIRDSEILGPIQFYAGFNSINDTTGGSVNVGWVFATRNRGGGSSGESVGSGDSVGGGGVGGGGGSEGSGGGGGQGGGGAGGGGGLE